MKKEQIILNINADKDLMKKINSTSFTTTEEFYNNVVRYIKAIKELRMICIIDSVSSSGMSRTIKFLECSKSTGVNEYRYYNFYLLFTLLGYQQVRDKYTHRISGCGMDMIFHTNYSNMHTFHRLGFINKKQCDTLAQATPHVA